MQVASPLLTIKLKYRIPLPYGHGSVRLANDGHDSGEPSFFLMIWGQLGAPQDSVERKRIGSYDEVVNVVFFE